ECSSPDNGGRCEPNVRLAAIRSPDCVRACPNSRDDALPVGRADFGGNFLWIGWGWRRRCSDAGKPTSARLRRSRLGSSLDENAGGRHKGDEAKRDLPEDLDEPSSRYC